MKREQTDLDAEMPQQTKRRARFYVVLAAALMAGCNNSQPSAPPGSSQSIKLLADAPGDAAAEKVVIHPEADRILKESCAKLAAASTMSCKVEAWSDEMLAGHKLSTTKMLDMQMKRPNLLQVEARSPKRSRGMWYDGKTLTVLDRTTNLYGVMDVPDTINKMLDAVSEKFGISIPLEDLISADPYGDVLPSILSGAYFGKATILGVPCQHIAFSTKAIDWQLWVEEGGQHLPRKIVITYKTEEAQPQYTAIFSDWVLDKPIADSTFSFSPPNGSSKIEVLPKKGDEE